MRRIRKKNTRAFRYRNGKRLCEADWSEQYDFIVENPDWLVGAD